MRGGNAIDAALATAFALAVHESAASHLGEQGNMLIHLAHMQKTTALDFNSCAPGGAHAAMYEWTPGPTHGGYRFVTKGDLNTTGVLAVAIPGNVCGWVTAQRACGSMPLSDVVAPAVLDARPGSLATPRTVAFTEENLSRLARQRETADVFLRTDGSGKRQGELLQLRKLADTIELISREGYEPFNSSKIAAAIVEHLDRSPR